LTSLYDDHNGTIFIVENKRSEQISEARSKIIEKFKGSNHVEIPRLNFSYTFDPMNMMVFESIGELHQNATVTDNWGKLESSKGLILDKENMRIFLTPATKIKGNMITGDGWELTLNDGWRINQEDNRMEIVNE
jgi:hypothetical protein